MLSVASAPTTLCPGTARSVWGGGDWQPHTKPNPWCRPLGCGEGQTAAGGTGIWVQANGRVSNIVCAFFSSCTLGVYIRRIRLLWCPPCPPLWLTPSTILLFPTAPFQTTTSRGQHTFYFQPRLDSLSAPPQNSRPKPLLLSRGSLVLELELAWEDEQVGRG